MGDFEIGARSADAQLTVHVTTACTGCALPVDLRQPHDVLVRQREREDQWGNTHVEGLPSIVARWHVGCPDAQSTVHATSKNADPDGCPDTVLGPCEWACARCGRGHDCPDVVARAQVAAVRGWCDLADEQGGGHSGKLHASTVRAALDAAAAGYV